MKKKIVVQILCLALLFLLSGCKGQTESENAQKEGVISETGTDTEVSADKPDTEKDVGTGAENEPVIPEYDSTKFEDIQIVAEALDFSITPVESFSNGFEFASFGLNKDGNLSIYYNKPNPDNSAENLGVIFIISPEEYIFDPKFDEARAQEDAVIEDIPVKVRLYTHYNCEGRWRELFTEEELDDLMASFATGAAGGGETDLNKEGKVEISEIYTMRWQQEESLWVSIENNHRLLKAVPLEDMKLLAQEFMQSCKK